MTLRQAYGMIRSLFMYYARVWKLARMRSFYAQFLGPGDLAFDVGAHVGNRSLIWSSLGVQVLALEPQQLYSKFLSMIFSKSKRVSVLHCGLADKCGKARIKVSDATPTVSSISESWTTSVQRDKRFSQINWNRQETVDMLTLDHMIKKYGTPKFCKIDVEGCEYQVLSGLNQAIPALSFEYIPVALDQSLACIDRLESLSSYEYNWSSTESMRFKNELWMNAKEMKSILCQMPLEASSGDIYAKKTR